MNWKAKALKIWILRWVFCSWMFGCEGEREGGNYFNNREIATILDTYDTVKSLPDSSMQWIFGGFFARRLYTRSIATSHEVSNINVHFMNTRFFICRVIKKLFWWVGENSPLWSGMKIWIIQFAAVAGEQLKIFLLRTCGLSSNGQIGSLQKIIY